MTQAEVTWGRAFKVYWSLFWRAALYIAVPAAIVASIAYRVHAEGILDLGGILISDVPMLAFVLIGLLSGVLLPTWVMKTVLRKAYSDFRIVLEAPPKRLKIEPRL